MTSRLIIPDYVGAIEPLNPTKFAQCTSCFTPMLGICDSALRYDCYECEKIHSEVYGVEKRYCKGL